MASLLTTYRIRSQDYAFLCCIRLAGKLQLLDQPGDRKVHVAAIPRVGGVGMILGVLLPILLRVPLNQEVKSLLAGIAILFIFGVPVCQPEPRHSLSELI